MGPAEKERSLVCDLRLKVSVSVSSCSEDGRQIGLL